MVLTDQTFELASKKSVMNKHFIFLTQMANSKDIFIRKLNRIRMKSDPALIVDAILKDLEANSGK